MKQKKHKLKLKKISFQSHLWVLGILVIAIVAAFFFFLPNNTATPAKDFSTIDLYVMSQCPYGVQAENAIIPAIRKLGENGKLNIYFIGNEQNGAFSSLHGQPEVEENLRQVCAFKQSMEKSLDYLVCVNKDIRNAESAWKNCASQAGLDSVAMEKCAAGEEGKALLSASFKKSDEVSASGSPTIFVNGAPYDGARSESAFLRTCCQGKDFAACSGLPECTEDSECAKAGFIGKCEQLKCVYTEPPKVNFIVINDKTCGDSCDTSQVIGITRRLFQGTQLRELDYSTEEAKALITRLNITALPAYIFDKTVEKGESFDRVSGAMVAAAEYYYISPAAVGAGYYIGRTATPKTLELFVMSQCPYGVQAENNMEEVLESFGSNIKFSIHFIATENTDGTFTSLHGQSEVDEDLRQVCIMEKAPANYFNYLMCVNKDIKNVGTIWKDCASENGIDPVAIETCVGSEDKELLRKNIAKSNELGIGSSPTFLVNNQLTFGGALPADSIKQKFCNVNKGTAGCEKTLTSAPQTVPTTGGCG